MLAHWDDVEKHRRAKGPFDALWSRLGDAAGTRSVGANRMEVAPGKLATPPHSHGASEEIFFVLGGSGLAWQDEEVCVIGAGDCIVHVADAHEHTLRAGPDGLDVLVFGTRHPVEYGWLPRSRALRLGYPWIEGRTDNPWDVEAQVGELEFAEPGERPANVVAADEVEAAYGGLSRAISAAAGSRTTGLKLIRLPSSRRGAPPHCHSAEEEVFVVLEGEGTLELWPVQQHGATEPAETHPLRAGHVVSRPPASRVAHSFRGGGDGDFVFLAYGTRDPNDITYYPRSNKFFLRGIGLVGRIEPLDYFDGEPDD